MRTALLLSLLACALLSPARAAGPVVGTVVTSDEWIVHRNPKGKEEEFTGHVHYHAGPTKVDADWALYKHAIKQWQARGHVVVNQVEKSGDIFTAHGDQGMLYESDRSGELTAKDRVTFERQAIEGGTDYGEAQRATWRGREVATLLGKVRTWGPRAESWSDRADYEAGKVTLTGGRPVVHRFEQPDSRWNGVVKADVVTAIQPEHRLDADGSAQGWLIFPGGEKSAKGRKKKPLHGNR